MLNCCEKFENLWSLFKGADLGDRIGGPIQPPNLPTNHPNNCVQYSLYKPYNLFTHMLQFVTICVQTVTQFVHPCYNVDRASLQDGYHDSSRPSRPICPLNTPHG